MQVVASEPSDITLAQGFRSRLIHDPDDLLLTKYDVRGTPAAVVVTPIGARLGSVAHGAAAVLALFCRGEAPSSARVRAAARMTMQSSAFLGSSFIVPILVAGCYDWSGGEPPTL